MRAVNGYASLEVEEGAGAPRILSSSRILSGLDARERALEDR
jgi:hypothetical protein